MTLKIQCPNSDCGQSYNARESHLGRNVVCKKCGQKFTLDESQASTMHPPPLRCAVQEMGSAQVADDTDLGAIPKKLGRFEIRSRLGAGAFGAVYRAYDPTLDREVALKVPHPSTLQSQQHRARILVEAKAAAQLRHPNIVPVYEAGKDGEHYYIASAFIEGQTLEEAIDEGRFDFRRSVQIVRDLAGALQYAHHQGVVHRDVKPANIMLDAHGDPLLMDFGLARLEESQSDLTTDGSVLGTPNYMPPEQASGRQDQVGPASDQYSLGVVLYKLLCGETPFSGPPSLVISMVINQEPPSPRAENPEISRDLETICLKAIAKDPKDRFVSCGELANDLRSWQHDEPITARRINFEERFWRWCRRNPVVAGLLATATLLLMTVVVVMTLAYLRTSRALTQAETTNYFHSVALAEQRVLSNDIVQAEGLLDACSPKLRHWEWGYLKRQCQLRLMTLPDWHTVLKIVFSADGKTFETHEHGGIISVWDSTTGRALAGRQEQGRSIGETWFQGLADKHNAESSVLESVMGQLPSELRGRHSTFAVSPNGKQVVFTSGAKVRVWRRTAEHNGRTLSHNGHIPLCVAFSPDGRRIVTGGKSSPRSNNATSHTWPSGVVKLWDAATGDELLNIAGHTGAVTCVAFSPDGRQIVSGGGDIMTGGDIMKVWNAENGQEELAFRVKDHYPTGAAFSPKRKLVALVLKQANGDG